MRVFAPVPFRWTDGIDYPYGWFDIADDSKARAMKAAGRVSDGVFDSPDDAITPQAVTQDPKTGLLYAGGVPVAGGWSPGSPTDQLLAPLQRVTITGALSTTQAQTATASGTYYKARVAWSNNGASASAKLRIAVNADNAVHGLVVGQSAKRRDYEMTMGDGVILTCGVPITSLTFSADGAITGATHQLQVTFGN